MLDQAEDVAERRKAALDRTLARIREFESSQGVSPEALADIKGELIALAAEGELFSAADFPAPAEDAEETCALYLLSEDPDHRFALYLQACKPGLDVPPHNHTTWACIVGLEGEEENRFYQRGPEGAVQTGGQKVGPGGGVAFLPDELHSIHIHGTAPVRNFHMYGLALDRLTEREFWSKKEQAWKIFPPQEGIIDRRAG